MPTDILDPNYIHAEIQAWMSMLGDYVPRTGFTIQKVPVRILDMGCGLAYEAIPLLGLFEGRQEGVRESDGHNAHFIGIDSNIIIDSAKILYVAQPNIELHCEDGRNVSDIVTNPVDILIYSNAQIKHPMGHWDGGMEEIIRKTIRLHREGGLLFMTFFSEMEADRVVNRILGDTYDVKVRQKNQYLNDQKKTRHNYVVAGIRN